MYQSYATDPQMRINVGIRRRLAPLLENSRRRIELLNSLLFSMPGTPVLYYGDEIGMGDNIYLGDRNGVRTPMQWTGDRNGGFSRADPARLYAPPIMDPVYGYQAINVEAQDRSPFSVLNWMRRMIGLRKQFSVFGRGTIDFMPAQNRKVLIYVRRMGEETILCVANLSRTVQPVELDLSRFKGMMPVEMVGLTEFPRIGDLPVLPHPGSVRVLLVQAPAGPHAGHGACRIGPVARDRAGAGPPGGRRVGDAARRQRAHADRARAAPALSAAAAMVRRQGASGAGGPLHRLGRPAARPPADVPHARRGRVRGRGAASSTSCRSPSARRSTGTGWRSVRRRRSWPRSPARARASCSTPGSTIASRPRCSRRSARRSRRERGAAPSAPSRRPPSPSCEGPSRCASPALARSRATRP